MRYKEHIILAGTIIGLIFGVVTCILLIDQIASRSTSASFIILYMAAIIFISTMIGTAIARMLYAAMDISLNTLKASGIFTRKTKIREKH